MRGTRRAATLRRYHGWTLTCTACNTSTALYSVEGGRRTDAEVDLKEHNQSSEHKEAMKGNTMDEFTCERCRLETDDTSYEPFCPDCYNDMLAAGEIEED